jgi:Holliday junction resolvase RusA-like endonuclease
LGEGLRFSFTVPGPPQPKERARSGKHGFYTPNKTSNYESLVAVHAAAAVQKWELETGQQWPRNVQYEVNVKAFFETRHRRDTDNVLKSVLDACNPKGFLLGLWADDSQVADTSAKRRFNKANPRTEVTVSVFTGSDEE